MQLQGKQTQDATFMGLGWEGQALLTLAHVDKYTFGEMLEKLCEVEGIAIPVRKDVREFMREAVRTGTIRGLKEVRRVRRFRCSRSGGFNTGRCKEGRNREGETEICHSSYSNFRLRVVFWV